VVQAVIFAFVVRSLETGERDSGVLLFSLGLGLVASFLGTVGASILLGVLGQAGASLAIAFGFLLLLRTIVGVAATFLSS
jgi:hypothetical protein